jgi:hypothetical protein
MIEIEESVENFLYAALHIPDSNKVISLKSISFCHVSFYPRLAGRYVVTCDGWRLHAYPIHPYPTGEFVGEGFYELGKRSLTPVDCEWKYPDWQALIADPCLNRIQVHLVGMAEDRALFDCGAELNRKHYEDATMLGQPIKCLGDGQTKPVMSMFENGAFAVIMPMLPKFDRKI